MTDDSIVLTNTRAQVEELLPWLRHVRGVSPRARIVVLSCVDQPRDLKRSLAELGLWDVHVLDRARLLRVLDAFEAQLQAEGLGEWAATVGRALEDRVFPGYGNMRNLNVLGVTWLLSSVLGSDAGYIREQLYLTYDDDVWPSVESIDALCEPLRRRLAECTFGFYRGKPPFPVPRHVHLLRHGDVAYELLAFSLCMPDQKARRLVDSIIASQGRVEFENESEEGVPCRPSGAASDERDALIYTPQYFGGNHAKTWDSLLAVPCLPSVDRRADDMLPGMMLDATGSRIAFLEAATVNHVKRPGEDGAFEDELSRVAHAVDLYHLVQGLIEEHSGPCGITFSEWYGNNIERVLSSPGLLALRTRLHDQYLRILKPDRGTSSMAASFEAVKQENDQVMRDYAVLLGSFGSCIEAYLARN